MPRRKPFEIKTKIPAPYVPYRDRPAVEQNMPVFLLEFLEGLTDDQTKILWEYLDGVSRVELDMVDAMLDAHPKVVKDNEAK